MDAGISLFVRGIIHGIIMTNDSPMQKGQSTHDIWGDTLYALLVLGPAGFDEDLP